MIGDPQGFPLDLEFPFRLKGGLTGLFKRERVLITVLSTCRPSLCTCSHLLNRNFNPSSYSPQRRCLLTLEVMGKHRIQGNFTN